MGVPHGPAAAGSRPRESRPWLSLLDDERLARMVGAGSERAFATLYERYHQPLYRYCRSIVGNDADAQDALQSALAGAFAALGRGQHEAPLRLRPWLFRIAHNEAISQLRRRSQTVELSEATECAAASVPDRAGERERLRTLVRDLGALSERQRGALVMRELNGLSHEQIALALGMSANAVKQAIFEARQGLMACEQGRAMTCEDVMRSVSDASRRITRSRRVRAHLRDCSECAAFDAAIATRGSDLRILAPPLAPAAAAGLIAGVLGTPSQHGGAGAALAAGSAGKPAVVALALKATLVAAVVATGSVGLAHALTSHTPAAPARVAG
ncbi:MAG: RNA polymerase sigma factor, partial [Solirubrobacteraceae bacterium]